MNAEKKTTHPLIQAVRSARASRELQHKMIYQVPEAEQEKAKWAYTTACEQLRHAEKDAMYAGVYCGSHDLFCNTPEGDPSGEFEVHCEKSGINYCCRKCYADALHEQGIQDEDHARFEDMAYGKD